MMKRTLTGLLALGVVSWAAFANDLIGIRIQEAGNAEDDGRRLAILRELAAESGLDSALKADLARMTHEIELYITSQDLSYFDRALMKQGAYDFGLTEGSPLEPLARLMEARMWVWCTLEYGGLWSDPVARRERFDMIRSRFERLRQEFPENRLVRMYLGEPIPPAKALEAPEGAPQWAVHQRAGLEGLADIIGWWIDHRMRADGQYGGGWGDDCEMWRWWTPVLLGFEDERINEAQARFSKALLSQEHMAGGYTSRVHDVEHTAEDSSDAMTPMMHLEPDTPEWRERAMRLADLMENLWTGVNERGRLQFKSTYFSSERVSEDPRQACDTVYHPRAVQPALLVWLRTRDARLGRLFTAWLDTWVDAAAREERGKPAGILPSAIHWPDGGIGGTGERWWDPENHSSDPLYVWPSAMSMMLESLLQAWFITGNEAYLGPIRSMVRIRLDHLRAPEESPEPGSAAWCAARMGFLQPVLLKHRQLTGTAEFDELLALEGATPMQGAPMQGDELVESLLPKLAETASALRINFPGYTSEVRYTDRVLRFPSLFGENGMFPDAVKGFPMPNVQVLYRAATGDVGDGLYFPMNAVRWLTPPRDIAALVTKADAGGLEARLYHFGAESRPMAAEFYLLGRGQYSVKLLAGEDVVDSDLVAVAGARARAAFELPPRKECRLIVTATGNNGE